MKINNILRTLYAGKYTWGFEYWGRWASAAALCAFLFSPASLRAQTTVKLSPCTNCKNALCSGFYGTVNSYGPPLNTWVGVSGYSETLDELDEFDPASGVFTAKEDGLYVFSVICTVAVGSDTSIHYMQLHHNGTSVANIVEERNSSMLSVIRKVQAGDTLQVQFNRTAGFTKNFTFSGARVDCASSGGDITAGTGIGAGTTAERPASPDTGTLRYNTDTAKLELWNGSAWVDIN